VLELAAAEAADAATGADPASRTAVAGVGTGTEPGSGVEAGVGADSGAGVDRPARPLEAVAEPGVEAPDGPGGAVVEPGVEAPGGAVVEPRVDAPVTPGAAQRRAEHRWFGRRAGWIAGATAAAAAAVLAVALLWPDPKLASYPVAGTAAQPGASAVLTLDPKPAGLAISITITGLPPSTSDTYYAAWLRGPDGVVPVGTFHWKKAANPIDLWSGVETSRYPTFFVTRQREGEPPTPSSEVVLEGRLG
jgi:hypothetical protein